MMPPPPNISVGLCRPPLPKPSNAGAPPARENSHLPTFEKRTSFLATPLLAWKSFLWGKPYSAVNHFTFGFEEFQTHSHNDPCSSAGLIPRSQQFTRLPCLQSQIGEMLRQSEWRPSLPQPISIPERVSGEVGRRKNTDGNVCGLPSQCPRCPQSSTPLQPGRFLFLKLEISLKERGRPKQVVPSHPAPLPSH